MASPTTQPVKADPEPIRFQVDHLSGDQAGRLEVRGRWSGIRGRRFFRPTLTLRAAGAEQRLLADLEHKPWAAQDGEEWRAAFPFAYELADVTDLELSVAPDIAVGLQNTEGTVVMADRASIAPAARPRADQPAARPSLSERAREIERLDARLSELDGALSRERARRAAADKELEDERRESLRLRSRVGQLSAELDLAHAAQQEAHAELEEARQSLQDQRADSEHRRAAGERRHAQNERLKADKERLEAETERLRDETQRLQAEIAELHDDARRELRERRLREAEVQQPREEGDRLRDPAPTLRQREPSPPGPVRDPARSQPPQSLSLQFSDPSSRSRPTPASERPLNPSLRSRTNWLGRALALLVILAVIAAVFLLIRTTVK
jgi:hypothetical protein